MTLNFNLVKEAFDDQNLNEFCLKNRILDYDSTFFAVGDDQYLSLLVKYETIADENKRDKMNKSVKNEIEQLDEKEKVLFDKMREIRNQKAREGGFPPYILATNNDMVHIIQKRCRNFSELKEIKGFGPTKLNGIGKEFIDTITVFFEAEETDNA